MQLLANSAGVKQQYQAELKGLKKDLKATRTRHKQDITSPSDVPREHIKVQIIKTENQRNAEVITETPRIDVRDGKITELEEHNARLKTEFKTLTQERDRVQSMCDSSEASLVDIVTECTEMHDQQVREKAKLQEQLSVSGK